MFRQLKRAFLLLALLAGFAFPVSADTDTAPPIISFINLNSFPHRYGGEGSGIFQTALKPGDQFVINAVISGEVSEPVVFGDLSSLGIPGVTSFSYVGGAYTFQNVPASDGTPFLHVGGVSSGLKEFSITATDQAGNTTVATSSFFVDSIPPVLSVTNLSTIDPLLQEGSQMTVSGTVDGTGTEAGVFEAHLILLNESNTPLAQTGRVDGEARDLHINHNGAFSASFYVRTPGDAPNFPANAAYAVLELLAVDEAGNEYSATSSPFLIDRTHATGASSVLFLPGIEGSALKEGDDVLWPPSVWSHDVARLALTESGDSINDIKVAGVLSGFYSSDLYGKFATFMDGLTDATGDGTIHEWKPFAYDWRFSPDKVISEGVNTPGGVVDIVQTVEQLAANSQTGKVTIVAHSMGGLLGKALIKKLQEEGKDSLVDAFVMVGTPQLGTPQAVASLLHGEQPLALEFFVRTPVMRSVAQNMQSAYDLLPSARYFENVADPVISFDTNASFTQPWRARWGSDINSYSAFSEFLTGAGLRTRPDVTDYGNPEVLRGDILASSAELHGGLDIYQIPSHIRTVQIAGWGLPTTKEVTYWNSHIFGIPTPLHGYKTIPTIEGDQTVVYSSALSSIGERYFFNLALFNNSNDGHDFDHKDLLSTDPIQGIIRSVIGGSVVNTNTYIRETRPNVSDVPEQMLITTRSPIVLGAYDSQGNFTGINQNQNLDAEILPIEKGIPGSNFLVSGEDQYIFLPKGGSYTFKFKGTGVGPASIEVANFSNDQVNPVSAYTDIPVTPATAATFVAGVTAADASPIAIDQNGDNKVDSYVSSDGGVLSLEQLIINLKTAVNGLTTLKSQQKTQLFNKVANIENKITKQKQKQSNALSKIQVQIVKKAGKGQIDTATANTLVALLDDLISQSALVPLNTALIQELRNQINGASINAQLKTSLLMKVTKVENISAVSRSINSMSQLVVKKGSKGVLTDAETQNLLNLLDQIQAAI
jgi:pimeloyl-ACP methyl ester carboxylesterase/CRISPR/Cas system CSM-associated protein Csm2 small subunit